MYGYWMNQINTEITAEDIKKYKLFKKSYTLYLAINRKTREKVYIACKKSKYYVVSFKPSKTKGIKMKKVSQVNPHNYLFEEKITSSLNKNIKINAWQNNDIKKVEVCIPRKFHHILQLSNLKDNLNYVFFNNQIIKVRYSPMYKRNRKKYYVYAIY